MDQTKVGSLIRTLRQQQGMTQLTLANQLGVSDKAVSKWERGLGCPDVELLPALSKLFQVDLQSLLKGCLPVNRSLAGNLNRIRFFACPDCGGWLYTTSGAEIACCGHSLAPLDAKPADEAHQPVIESIEDECYLTFSHEMTKNHFIRFAVWVGFDRTFAVQLYPEQKPALRLPTLSGRGTLYLLCSRDGLMKLPL